MKKIVVLALLSAVMTMVLGYVYLSNNAQSAEPVEIERTPVVVASDIINKNTLITEEMVDTVLLPEEAVLMDSVREVDSVIGMLSETQLLPGEQLLVPKLINSGETGSGLAYIVSDGMRAYTIAVDAISGLAGMIEPGNHVDVYGLLTVDEKDGESGSSQKNSYSFLLLQDINVLAIENNMELLADAVEPLSYESVTLELYPDQIADLNLVANVGRVQLALRSPIDESEVKTDIINPAELMTDIYRRK